MLEGEEGKEEGRDKTSGVREASHEGYNFGSGLDLGALGDWPIGADIRLNY